MRALALAVRAICGCNAVIGHVFSWLSLGIVAGTSLSLIVPLSVVPRDATDDV